MWIKIIENYLVVITVLFTFAHCSFTVKRTESMYLDLNDSNTLMLANTRLVNAWHHTNRTIVKRAAPNAYGPPLAVIPPDLSHGPETAETIELYMFKYPIIKAAHIGTQTFSCRQDTHQLAVVERVHGTHKVIIRMRKQEYYLHPKPGVWWFIKCVGMETGGAGLDVTGVQKPGGDSGIDPNALKSLVG